MKVTHRGRRERRSPAQQTEGRGQQPPGSPHPPRNRPRPLHQGGDAVRSGAGCAHPAVAGDVKCTHRDAVHPEPPLAQHERDMGPAAGATGEADALGIAHVTGTLQGLTAPRRQAMGRLCRWSATHHPRTRRQEPQAPRRQRPGRVRLLHACHAHWRRRGGGLRGDLKELRIYGAGTFCLAVWALKGGEEAQGGRPEDGWANLAGVEAPIAAHPAPAVCQCVV